MPLIGAWEDVASSTLIRATSGGVQLIGDSGLVRSYRAHPSYPLSYQDGILVFGHPTDGRPCVVDLGDGPAAPPTQGPEEMAGLVVGRRPLGLTYGEERLQRVDLRTFDVIDSWTSSDISRRLLHLPTVVAAADGETWGLLWWDRLTLGRRDRVAWDLDLREHPGIGSVLGTCFDLERCTLIVSHTRGVLFLDQHRGTIRHRWSGARPVRSLPILAGEEVLVVADSFGQSHRFGSRRRQEIVRLSRTGGKFAGYAGDLVINTSAELTSPVLLARGGVGLFPHNDDDPPFVPGRVFDEAVIPSTLARVS